MTVERSTVCYCVLLCVCIQCTVPASRRVVIVVGDHDTARENVVPAGQWIPHTVWSEETVSGVHM